MEFRLDIHSSRRPLGHDVSRIALIGNFSGHPGPFAAAKRIVIDAENFEPVMERLGVEVTIGETSLRFTSLEDFHPDEIYARSPLFDSIKAAREEVHKPVQKPTVASGAPVMSLLDAIVEGAPVPPKPHDRWDDAIQSLVAPHVIPKPDASQRELQTQIDELASAMMRAILDNPAFQAVEAAWRSVFQLLRHLESGNSVRLELIDVSREELLANPENLNLGGAALAVALFSFGVEDSSALEQLARIAKAASAPFIAATAQAPDPDNAAWQHLRSLPEARWIGLAMPRFLLRLPYGPKTSRVEALPFEEMPDAPVHEKYLWGNPAVAVACLAGEAIQSGLAPGSLNLLEGVPIHCYAADEAQPPAEVWMTERQADALLDCGVMPLASIRNRDAVQVIAFQSIADPAAPLAGFGSAK